MIVNKTDRDDYYILILLNDFIIRTIFNIYTNIKI